MSQEPDFKDILAGHRQRLEQEKQNASNAAKAEEERRMLNTKVVSTALDHIVRPIFEAAFRQLDASGYYALIEGVKVECGPDRAIALVLTFRTSPENSDSTRRPCFQLGYRGFPSTLSFHREGSLPAETLALESITPQKIESDIREFLTLVFKP